MTFLLADSAGVMRRWERERIEIRERFKLGGRRHAFKSLGDELRQKALVPFLRASSEINGVILSVAIDNSLLETTFGYEFSGASEYKPLVKAKLIRIAVLGSMLVGGLSSAGQNLMWLTDDDEIVGNERQYGEIEGIVGSLLQRFCPHGLGDITLGIASKFDDGFRAEDLCSIPDLVGGAMCESLNSLDGNAIPKSVELYTPALTRLSTKAELVQGWLATLNGPLKKLFCLIRPSSEGSLVFSFADPTVGPSAQSDFLLWRPPDKGWLRSSRAW